MPSCRIVGSIELNKVQGNFHITTFGHGYFGPHTYVIYVSLLDVIRDHDKMNFTHRIDRLQFGIDYPGLMNPLDKTYQVAHEGITNSK